MSYTHRNWREIVTGFIVTCHLPPTKRSKFLTELKNNENIGFIDDDTPINPISTSTTDPTGNNSDWMEPLTSDDFAYSRPDEQLDALKVIAAVGATLTYQW